MLAPDRNDVHPPRALWIIGAIGLGLTLIGWVVDRERAAAGLLVGAQFGLGLAIGGLALVAFSHLMGAGWIAAIRRVPEALAGALPIASVLVFVSILLALPIYEWTHGDVVKTDPLLAHKSPWLNIPGVLLRALVCLGAWCLFAAWIRRSSRNQDEGADTRRASSVGKISALFVVVFALTWSVGSFDWVMSLEPHWFSTIYAMYTFASAFTSSLAAVIMLAVFLERGGVLRGVLRTEHLHDLGKLLFGFVTFWAYLWFCQYMLIWYSDIPEETVYFVKRTSNGWMPYLIGTVIVFWMVPFLSLLPRPAKRSRQHLVRIGAVVLLGRWMDLHCLIAPAVSPLSPGAVLWEITALVGVVPLVVWGTLRAFARSGAVPVNDPYLTESVTYHVT